MPRFNSKTLISELEKEVNSIISQFDTKFSDVDSEILNIKPAKGKWSALECIEHLNMVGRYYLPQIEKELDKQESKSTAVNPEFKSGFMGNYMYNAMKPHSDGSIHMKVKTFSSVNPSSKYDSSDLNAQKVLASFIKQKRQLLELLENSRGVDLNKVKITSLVGPILRLKLGDVFRFLIAHEHRHLIQAENAIANAMSAKYA
ncbi:DinB family protein [Chondrinema litorale]|uniref:DinB family protein n=1 Tax=Chondrinema litorale TaxID=2994555 RepID=UPI002542B046|nr:DinB family protein [Chondrinema litorale]UZR94335.1 DinB family protein [Chondrinema litorale]